MSVHELEIQLTSKLARRVYARLYRGQIYPTGIVVGVYHTAGLPLHAQYWRVLVERHTGECSSMSLLSFMPSDEINRLFCRAFGMGEYAACERGLPQ